METEKKPKGYWTKERCQEEALKYNIISDFMNNSSSAYAEALRNKWTDIICSHMVRLRVVNSFWSKDECIKASKTCTTKAIFKKQYSYPYKICIKNDWMNDLCKINNWKYRIKTE